MVMLCLSYLKKLLVTYLLYVVLFYFRQPMPVLPEQGYTKLDVNMRKHRMAELVSASLLLTCCSFCLIYTECNLV